MQERSNKRSGRKEYAHILKYTGVFGGVQGLSLLASILRNKFAAVLLGPSGLGLVSIYNTTLTLISNSTNFGIPFSSVQNISARYDEKFPERVEPYIRVVRTWSVWTAILGILICCCSSFYLSLWTFGNSDYTYAFILLSPIVGLAAISSGELAILKSVRKLRPVALVSLLSAIASLFISVPLYYFLGNRGIIPSLSLLAFVTMSATLYYSCNRFPFRVSLFSPSVLLEGSQMIKLGLAYIFAGILGSGVEYAIRAYMLNYGSLDTVGLYNAGYAITVTYSGLIFTAMGTDYFPRLSSITNNVRKLNVTVNRQIEISLVLVAPMIIAFILGMSLILPLLYAKTFFPVIGMAKCAAFSIYFRAITLPMAYIPLAKGDSMSYLLLEFINNIFVILFIILGYHYWELLGTGVAITLAGIFDMVVIFFYARLKYGLRLSKKILMVCLTQVPLGIVAFVLTFCLNGALFWVIGISCMLVSLVISLVTLQKKVDIIGYLKIKVSKKNE